MNSKNDTKKITIVVSNELYNRISSFSCKEDRSMNKQVIRMIEYFLDAHETHPDSQGVTR
jgi:hypothetical protein